MFLNDHGLEKAKSLKEGDMVSWNSSGGRARGKVIRVIDSGSLPVPNTKFQIKGEKDNPAVLIQLYRDGKETDIKVGHKMSSLTKSLDEQLLKHASHNQSSHGKGGGAGTSETKSFTPAKISAKDIKVGDRLDKAGKTRVHAVKMIGEKIAVGLKTRGSGTGGFKSWNPEEDITVFRKVVGFELFKHGSHNQKTHAGSRGGGTGFDSTGRGGGVDSTDRQSSKFRDNELTSEAAEKVGDMQVKLENYRDEDSGDYIGKLSDDDERILDGLIDDLGEAEEQLNLANDAESTKGHLDKMENALTRLDDSYEGAMNADNRTIKGMAEDVDILSGKLEDFYGALLGR